MKRLNWDTNAFIPLDLTAQQTELLGFTVLWGTASVLDVLALVIVVTLREGILSATGNGLDGALGLISLWYLSPDSNYAVQETGLP